jgi:peroxiredoxin
MLVHINAERAVMPHPKAAAPTVVAGMVAPSFVLPDQHGTMIDSARLLARGPLAVFFFRSLGCDYCRGELATVERAMDLLLSRGGSIVGISRYEGKAMSSLNPDASLGFPMLNDLAGAVMDAFGLRSTASADQTDPHRGDWNPVPARFVIAPDGVVAYGDADPDYTRRPDAAELAPVVWRIATAFKSPSSHRS